MDPDYPRMRSRRGEAGTWPFNDWGGIDLKVRVAVMDPTGDHMVVLYLIKNSDYLNPSNRPPEREADNWYFAIKDTDLPDDSTVEIDRIYSPARLPHADVLIVIGQWIGAGAVSVLISELWRKARESKAIHGRPIRGVDRVTIREAEEFARWSIAVQYGDLRDDPHELELLAEQETGNRWCFDFKANDGTEYSIEMVQPDGIPFALRASISRRLAEAKTSQHRQRPTLARYWPGGKRDHP